MFFDIIFGIFVTGLFAMSSGTGPITPPDDPHLSQTPPPALPMAPPEASGDGALPLPAAPAPGYVQDMILEQLACATSPDPSVVVMALLQEGMINTDERITYESINCFPLHNGAAIAGMPFQMICVSVNDDEADALEVIFERDPEFPGHPTLSLGTDVDLATLKQWYAEQFGAQDVDSWVVDGLYTPEGVPAEVYCDKPDWPE